MLNDMQAEGTVVVARWYGGQNIGPVRFTHIENTAKEAVWKWQVVEQAARKDEAAKKQKREEDEERQALEEDLRERDRRIFAMRGLLAEKKAKLEDSAEVPLTPQKQMNYGSMSLEVLQRQDKSRDATITLILKKLNELDDKLKDAGLLEEAEQEGSTQGTWKSAQEYQEMTEDVPVASGKD